MRRPAGRDLDWTLPAPAGTPYRSGMSLEPGAAAGAPSGAFAELLRAHRQGKGLTQEEFAAKAGVGVRTLRGLERGPARPQRSTLEPPGAALEPGGPQRPGVTPAARP